MPSEKRPDQKYTYKDYLSWNSKERWELIHGVAYKVSLAPLRRHQEICISLAAMFFNFLTDKPCKVYTAPFDVRFPGSNEQDDDINTVVQPDIIVVCDKSKLDEKGMKGAPDLVVEIISASTAHKDLNEKFYLYEKHGVKEYWIIHPHEETIMVFIREKNGKYGRPKAYAREDTLIPQLFPGMTLELRKVFAP